LNALISRSTGVSRAARSAGFSETAAIEQELEPLARLGMNGVDQGQLPFRFERRPRLGIKIPDLVSLVQHAGEIGFVMQPAMQRIGGFARQDRGQSHVAGGGKSGGGSLARIGAGDRREGVGHALL
jgi:hypothetical protein